LRGKARQGKEKKIESLGRRSRCLSSLNQGCWTQQRHVRLGRKKAQGKAKTREEEEPDAKSSLWSWRAGLDRNQCFGYRTRQEYW